MNHPSLRSALLACAVAALAWLPRPCPAADADPATVYKNFNTFCLESFGAEKEPLTYERFGDTLAVAEDSRWMHVSERSACIAWGTNLPARTVVEYGQTPDLGSRTAEPERPFYTHVHYLKDLEPNTTYYYRLIATDERGQAIHSEVETFTTSTPDAGPLVRIDQAKADQPIQITSPGHYLLTTDLVASGTAFDILASNVTLDLGGHTVTYNQAKMEPIQGDSAPDWFAKAPQGVRIATRNLKNVKILNGTIRQGAGGDGAQPNGRGANPIGSMSGVEGEIAGLTIEWYGEQVCGLMLQWAPPIDVHHNVLTDMGTGITNRHQGVAAIQSAPKPHHNLIKRTRQRGIDCVNGGDVYANEIYIDSCATNSTGIATYKTQNITIRDNRVFGGGYLAIGIGALSQGTQDVNIFNNFVHLQASAPSAAWAEYGEQSGAYCFRVTWGGQNIDAHHNYFITYGRDGGMVRGIWYCPDTQQQNNRIHDNVIKAVVQNDKSDLRGAIVISGNKQSTQAQHVLFQNNRVISNFCHVLLGEPYGAGNNASFIGNTFERIGDLPRFRWVQIGYGNMTCAGSVFTDPSFVGDVSPQQVRWEGSASAKREFDLGYTLKIHASPGATVTVTDQAGKTAAEGTVKDNGVFEAPITAVRYANGSSTSLTPHTVTLRDGSRSSTRSIVIDRPVELQW